MSDVVEAGRVCTTRECGTRVFVVAEPVLVLVTLESQIRKSIESQGTHEEEGRIF